MKRIAFTMTELMVGLMVLAITSTVVIVNVNALKGQTAKREAEKLAQWLTTRMTIADSRNEPFKLKLNDGKVYVHWGESEVNEADKEFFDASKGCTFSLHAPNNKLEYRPAINNFTQQGGHITVIGKEGSSAPYYVVIAMIGGRVRVSDTKPSS